MTLASVLGIAKMILLDKEAVREAHQQLQAAKQLLESTPPDNFVSDIFTSRFACGYEAEYLEWVILKASVVEIRSFRRVIPHFPSSLESRLRPQCQDDYVCYERTMEVCRDLGLPLNYCEGVLFKRSGVRYSPEPHAWISYERAYVDIARELGGHIFNLDIYFLTFEVPCKDALELDQRYGQECQFPCSDFLAYPHWQFEHGLTEPRT